MEGTNAPLPHVSPQWVVDGAALDHLMHQALTARMAELSAETRRREESFNRRRAARDDSFEMKRAAFQQSIAQEQEAWHGRMQALQARELDILQREEALRNMPYVLQPILRESRSV